MSAIGRFVDKIKHRRAVRLALCSPSGPLSVTPATSTSPPVIHGPFGDTTEIARRQAAINMRADDGVRARVLELLTSHLGSEEKALAYCKIAYPEAGWDEETI